MNKWRLIAAVIIGISFLPISVHVSASNIQSLKQRTIEPQKTTSPKNVEKTFFQAKGLKNTTMEPNTEGDKVKNINSRLQVDVPILMFHHIEQIDADLDPLGYGLSYAPDKFERLLVYLDREQIKTMTFKDLHEHLLTGSVPEKSIILTFDDGYANNYHNAFPLLEKHHAKAVFFPITEHIGSHPWYMGWVQLRTLSDSGHEIGSHGMTHANLTSLSPLQVDEEIRRSKALLEMKLQQRVISFCYPSGKQDLSVARKVAENGFLFARGTGYGTTWKWQDRYHLPTIRIHPETDAVRSVSSFFSQ